MLQRVAHGPKPGRAVERAIQDVERRRRPDLQAVALRPRPAEASELQIDQHPHAGQQAARLQPVQERAPSHDDRVLAVPVEQVD